MSKENNMGCDMVGLLDIKGQDQCRRVYSVDGIAPTLTTSGGGQRQVKIFDTKRLRVRKLTPREYGILQAFPMDRWNQVVSDSQAYKQFGNAVTTTVFTPIAEQIKIAILESEGESMEELNKAMNEPEEKQEAKDEEKRENIRVEELAEKIISHLFEKTFLPGFVFDAAMASTIIFINENLDGIHIGEKQEETRDWPAAQKALETELDKYAGMGASGIYILKALTPLKARLDEGERTPELFNAIVDATR